MLAVGYLFALLSIIGWIWIIVAAFQNGDTVMGVVSILCGIAAIVYGVQNMDTLKVPLILMLVGIVGRIVVAFTIAGDVAAT